MSVAGGEETQVLDQGRESFWTLTDQGIYFGVVNSSLAPVIKFYTFGNGQVGIVKEFPKGTKFPMAAVELSVSPDGQWILYSQYDHASSDLMLMENYR